MGETKLRRGGLLVDPHFPYFDPKFDGTFLLQASIKDYDDVREDIDDNAYLISQKASFLIILGTNSPRLSPPKKSLHKNCTRLEIELNE